MKYREQGKGQVDMRKGDQRGAQETTEADLKEVRSHSSYLGKHIPGSTGPGHKADDVGR